MILFWAVFVLAQGVGWTAGCGTEKGVLKPPLKLRHYPRISIATSVEVQFGERLLKSGNRDLGGDHGQPVVRAEVRLAQVSRARRATTAPILPATMAHCLAWAMPESSR